MNIEYSLSQVKQRLIDYSKFTELELVLGFNKTVYEITVNGDINDCCISAYNRRFEGMGVSIDDLFDPERELYMKVLTRLIHCGC